MNKFKTLLFLAVFSGIALWGCDDSSSASSNGPDENATAEYSSSICKDCDDESSSSAKKIESSDEKDVGTSSDAKTDESSSSKGKETSSSSEKSVSSSSVKSGNSSSSNKDVSSSSVRSSSSGNLQSSSSNKDSSSSTKSSSSFEVDTARLCTPDYNLCNRPLFGDSIRSGAYKKFTDKRNGRTYFYLTINGKNKDNQPASVTVMAENLNVGEMIDGAMDQSSDLKIERYCYDNDTMKCEEYGGLYQWAEMMKLPSECNAKSCADSIKPNHQGICPDGWRLLTYDDFYIVVHADGNKNSVADVRAMGFGGHNYSGYSLIGSGYRTNEGQFEELNETAYWFYPSEHTTRFTRGGSGYNSKKTTYFSSGYGDKVTGLSVRCVKKD
jgi:uncharacterized protein (TIGR02145 family)